MAKYIKQEMIDLSGKGKEKIYYRLQSERNIDFNALAEYVGRHSGMMSKGLVMNVMEHVVNAMAKLLGEGHSVTIDGLGTFRASLGLTRTMKFQLRQRSSAYQLTVSVLLLLSLL